MKRPAKALLTVLVANAALFLAFTLPRTLAERSLASRAETLRADVERERRRVAALKEKADLVRANGRDTDRFFRDVVKNPKDDLLPTIQYLEKTARELGLSVTARNYVEEEVKGLGLTRFAITMPMSGPYRQIVAFLDRLEHSTRFLVVDQIQLRVRSEGGADLLFGLSAYFKPEAGGHAP